MGLLKITSDEIDFLGHKLRSEVEAILVGKNTWELDKPSLSTRHFYSEFQADIIVLKRGEERIDVLEDGRKLNFISASNPDKLKKKIFDLGYKSVLIEGGAEVFQYFMENNLFHEIYTYENQNLILQTGVEAPRVKTDRYRLIQQNIYCNHQIHHYIHSDLLLKLGDNILKLLY